MNKKVILIIIGIVVLILVSTGIYFRRQAYADEITSQEVSFSEEPSNVYYTEDEIKTILRNDMKDGLAKASYRASDECRFYESATKQQFDKVKYQYNEYSLDSYYYDNDIEIRFVWEYSVDNAQKLLSNTIEQLNLVEIVSGSDRYTYFDWKNIDAEYIDIFWVEEDQSFVANIPKDLLIDNIEKAMAFCSNETVVFE